jgi:hypothetical protein
MMYNHTLSKNSIDLSFGTSEPNEKSWVTKKLIPAVKRVVPIVQKVGIVAGKVATVASLL